jgi:hypothetical protein
MRQSEKATDKANENLTNMGVLMKKKITDPPTVSGLNIHIKSTALHYHNMMLKREQTMHINANLLH